MTLSAIEDVMTGIGFGEMDYPAPTRYASKHKRKFDVFIVYTDNETNGGYMVRV